MSFFNKFPKIGYDLFANGVTTQVTDIFRNIDANDVLLDTSSSYQYYNIINGDRPDVVSYKLYNDPQYQWSFFIVNNHLKEGLNDWPKSSAELEKFVSEHYDTYSIIEFSNINEPGQILNGLELPRPLMDHNPNVYITTFDTMRQSYEEDPTKTPPTWKVFKYDSSRFQLWIHRPAYLSGNNGYSFSAGVNGGFVLFSTDRPWLEKYSAWIKANDYDTWQSLLNASTYSETSIEFLKYLSRNFKLLPNSSSTGTKYAWYVGREAPYSFTDSSKSPKTTLDIRTGNIIGTYLETSYATFEKENNDTKSRIRVITPAMIRSFSEAYETLINE